MACSTRTAASARTGSLSPGSFPADEEPVRVCPSHSGWLHEPAELYDLTCGSSWSIENRVTLGAVLDLPSFGGAVKLPTGRFLRP